METKVSHNRKPESNIGVSGYAFYVPPFRVQLKDWCRWTKKSWEKVEKNVGRSFRVATPKDSVYTMAANAALRLILNYEINPEEIGFIGLGTESSTDNSAGCIIVRGMLDEALETLGKPRISRQCEVPEFKHACLGGVYALKSALRYVATDGVGRKAIVISSDLAEYERGSTGEQTQGAGAVAQLVEENPKLFAVDLKTAAGASTYRGVDFRKPHRTRLNSVIPNDSCRLPDYPVFNGKYSTLCYTDQTISALANMTQKLKIDIRTLFNDVEGAFFHRPFHSLPINVLASLYVWGLSQTEEHLQELRILCNESGADFDTVVKEAYSTPDFFRRALDGHINIDVYPQLTSAVKYFKRTHKFKSVLTRKMRYGVDRMMDFGNLYTGSLPAWIAAGLEDAADQGIELSEKSFLTIGYGSGDAAEAMMIHVVDGWQLAASKLNIKSALESPIDLTQEEYEALHDGLASPCPEYEPIGQFIVDYIGDHRNGYHDMGIEYYRYVPADGELSDLKSEKKVS